MIVVIHTPIVRVVKIEGWDAIDTALEILNSKLHISYMLVHDIASIPELVRVNILITCSRRASHQLVRHRLATFVQESNRFQQQSPIVILPRSFYVRNRDLIDNFLNNVYKTYKELVNKGEELQYVAYLLSQAFATTLMLSTNLRHLKHIIDVRLCRRAQPETAYIAFQIYKHLSILVEELEVAMLPRCVQQKMCLYNIKKRGEKVVECFMKTIERAIKEHGNDDEIVNLDLIKSRLMHAIQKVEEGV